MIYWCQLQTIEFATFMLPVCLPAIPCVTFWPIKLIWLIFSFYETFPSIPLSPWATRVKSKMNWHFFRLKNYSISIIVSLHQWLLKLTSLCIILIGVSIRLLSLPYSGLTLFIHPDINNNTTQYRCWYLMLLLLWVEYTVLLLLLGIEQSFTISTIYGFFTPFILQLPSLNIFRLFSQWINYPSDFQKVDFTM